MRFNFFKKISALRKILDYEDQLGFLKLSFLLVISVFLEIIALSFLAPILSLLQGSEIEVPMIALFINLKEFTLINLLICTTLIVILKNIIQFYTNHYQNTISFSYQRKLSNKVFKHYLNNTYISNSKSNSSDVINNVTKVINTVCQYMILPLLYYITEITLILSISTYLLFFDFYTSVLIGAFFGVFLYMYNIIVSKRLVKLGKEIIINDSLKIKYITESIMSFVHIKLGKKQNYFLNKFNEPNQLVTKALTLQFSLRQLPKYYFEVLLYLFLLLLVFLQSQDSFFLTKLGVFVASLIKILPSLNKLTGSFQSIKFSESALNQLLSFNLNETEVINEYNVQFNKGIYIDHVSFAYSKKTNVLNDFSFSITKNTTVGIIGDSGKGKTTLLNLLLGNLFPNSGSIKIDDKPLTKHSVSSWQSKIGYLSQKIYLIDDTMFKNIAFGVDVINRERVNQVIKLAQLESLKNTLDFEKDLLGENGNKLSGGQIQRIGLARALYHDPSVLFLDEFTSALDDETEKEILKDVRKLKQNKTIIIISHKKSILDFCDNTINLNESI